MLINLTRQAIQPQRTAFTIATCLDPAHQALYKSLSELVAAGPPLLHQAEARSTIPSATWQPGSPPSAR